MLLPQSEKTPYFIKESKKQGWRVWIKDSNHHTKKVKHAYRKFWSLEEIRSKELSLKKLENIILKNVPDEFDKYDVILGKPFYINHLP